MPNKIFKLTKIQMINLLSDVVSYLLSYIVLIRMFDRFKCPAHIRINGVSASQSDLIFLMLPF